MIRILVWAGVVIICLISGFLFGVMWNLNNARNAAFILGGLALGVVIGFIIDWLLEEGYRRNRELEREIELIRQYAAPNSLPNTPPLTISGQSEEVTSQALVDFLRQREEEVKQLRTEMDQTEVKLQKLNDEFEAYVETHPDDLTAIKGIGPVFHWKLRDLGINSFKQLAEADNEQLRRMLGIKNWQKVDIEGWIAQAKDWAERTG